MVPLYLPKTVVFGLLCGVEHCLFVWDPDGIDISEPQMTNQDAIDSCFRGSCDRLKLIVRQSTVFINQTFHFLDICSIRKLEVEMGLPEAQNNPSEFLQSIEKWCYGRGKYLRERK